MTQLAISLATNYAHKWGVWEALREIFQNALDAQDSGQPMQVVYEKERLTVRSTGVKLSRACLLLGGTDAEKPKSRGVHHEGLKLALLVLVRERYSVLINNADERWYPILQENPDFGGAKTLKINIRTLPQDAEKRDFMVTVEGISKETWALCQRRIIPLQPLPVSDTWKMDEGATVLLDEAHRGDVYSRGIWVCNMPELQFGYDMPLELNRDREVPDLYDLRWRSLQALNQAVEERGDEAATRVYSAVLAGSGEFDKNYIGRLETTPHLRKMLAEKWRREHGEMAVPCCTDDEAEEAQGMGLKPIRVPAKQRDIIVACGISISALATKDPVMYVDRDEDTLSTREAALLAEIRRAVSCPDAPDRSFPVHIGRLRTDAVAASDVKGPQGRIVLSKTKLKDAAVLDDPSAAQRLLIGILSAAGSRLSTYSSGVEVAAHLLLAKA